MADVPRIRATYAKILLEQIDALPEREAIRAHIHFGVLSRVTETPGRLAFIEGEDYQAILSAAHAELSPAIYVELLRVQTNIFAKTPVIAATVKTVLRLVGSSPHAVLRNVPRLREATVKGYGALLYEHADERVGHFQIRGYPVHFMNSANTLLFEATFLGCLDITGATGEAVLTRDDVERGDQDWTVRWK